MRLESQVGVVVEALPLPQHAKDFGSYLGSNVMPSKGVIKGSDNCAYISL